MSTKKTKKPARSVRYLLSTNSRLQRISLRRLSAAERSGKRRTRVAAAKDSSAPALVSAEPKSQESAQPQRNQVAVPTPSSATGSPSWTMSPRAVAITAVGVTAFAVLMATRQPASRPDAADVARQLQADQLAVATAGARVDRKQVVPAAPRAAVESSARTAEPSAAVKPTIAAPKASTVESTAKTPAAETVKAAAVEPPAKASATPSPAKPATEAVAPATESAVKTPAEPAAKAEPQTAPIKITGCLETNDEQAYRLTDTIGQDAPKSRSWKSGFLRKRSSNIDIVDSGHTLDLEHHVGQRVEATGTLTNREMKAHSLRRVAASCS